VGDRETLNVPTLRREKAVHLTKEQLAQFVEGVKKGADDAIAERTNPLDGLEGDPYFAVGVLQGNSLVCRAIDDGV
jgi:hypothetical protein